eukprot:scaffold40428_cov54-Phaeocystis_antarctica.AAC.2
MTSTLRAYGCSFSCGSTFERRAGSPMKDVTRGSMSSGRATSRSKSSTRIWLLNRRLDHARICGRYMPNASRSGQIPRCALVVPLAASRIRTAALIVPGGLHALTVVLERGSVVALAHILGRACILLVEAQPRRIHAVAELLLATAHLAFVRGVVAPAAIFGQRAKLADQSRPTVILG